MGLTGYMGIGLIVMALALAGSGLLIKSLYKDIGAFQATQEANKRELQRAVDKVEEIKALRELDQQRILLLSDVTKSLEAEVAATALKMDKWRSTLDRRTLAKPEVTRRAARASLRRDQCRLWRDTGGLGACPK